MKLFYPLAVIPYVLKRYKGFTMNRFIKLLLGVVLTTPLIAQQAGPVAAVPGTPGLPVVYGTPIQGTPVLIPGTAVPTGSKAIFSGTVTATQALTAVTTITGVTTSSKCVFSATNPVGGIDMTANSPYIVATANTVTINFVGTIATTGGTFAILCSVS